MAKILCVLYDDPIDGYPKSYARGIGSDHVDLQAAIEKDVTVTEITYCNSNSVAEHNVMAILALAHKSSHT